MPCYLGLAYNDHANALPAAALVSITTKGEGDRPLTKKTQSSLGGRTLGN